ncbi:MAG TPA: cation diffusion facilitator family transporter [Limnochordia bacterium]|nr:cation diffusion facilitator family transporter [Limnochordia bacterium]
MASHVHVGNSQLGRAFFLALGILIVESVGGWLAGSLALLSDAVHMLTDAGAVGLAWLAMRQGQRRPTEQHTYGFLRAGVLAALANALTLFALTVWIAYAAVQRLLHPQAVDGGIMLVVAAIGLAGNLYIGLGLRDHAHDLNVRAAMLHVLGDAAASAGVLIAGGLIALTGLHWLDPAVGLLIAGIILVGAWRIFTESYQILMEHAPQHIDASDLRREVVARFADVADLHDLHIWQLTSGKVLLSCHAVVGAHHTVAEIDELLHDVKGWLAERYGVVHSTIEVESSSACATDCFDEQTPALGAAQHAHAHAHAHDAHAHDHGTHDHDHGAHDHGTHDHDHRS